MKKRIILTSLLIGAAGFLTGCQEDLKADAAAGIEIKLISDGRGRDFGTPRATFIPSPNIVPGKERDVNAPAPFDYTYTDKFSNHNSRRQGYLCSVLGECD